MFVCPKCQVQTEQQYKFCPQCGYSHNENASPSTTPEGNPPLVQGGAAPQGGVPQQNGAAPQGGVPQQGGAAPQGGVPQQGGAAPQGGVPQQNGATPQGGVPAWLKSKKFKLFAGIGLGAAIIIVAVVTAFNVFLSKNPKELYLYAELQTYLADQKGSSLLGEDDTAFFEKLKEVASDTTMTLTGGLTTNGTELDPSFKQISDEIKNGSIELNLMQNPEQKWGQYGFKINAKEESIVDALLLFYDDVIAVKGIAEMDKMHYASMSELRKILDGNTDEDKEDGESLPKVTEEQMNKLIEKYGSLILSQLKDEYFSLESGVSYSTSEGNVKAKKLTISINEQQVKELLVSVVDTLRADEEAKDILAQYIAQYADTNINNLTEAEHLEYVHEQIEMALYTMKDAFIYSNSTGNLDMVLYLNNKNIIIDRSITVKIKDSYYDNELELKLNQTNWDLKKSDDKSTFDAELKVRVDYEEIGLKLKSVTTTAIKDDIRDANSDIELTAYTNGYEEFSATGNWRAREATKKGQEDRYTFEVTLNVEGVSPTIKGDFTRKVDQNLAGNFSNQEIKGSIDASVVELGARESYGVELALSTKTTFNKDLAKPVLDTDAINLAEQDSDESYYMVQDFLYELRDILPMYDLYY